MQVNYEVIKNRHAVRNFLDKPLEREHVQKLKQLIEDCNKESNLHIQLVMDEPNAFDGFLAHYGKFSGVKNYIAMVGTKDIDLEEKCGYYGEKIVLHAQAMGLNTCWSYMTYKKVKDAFVVENNEKLVCVIAIGYGIDQGKGHPVKTVNQVVVTDEAHPFDLMDKYCPPNEELPDWFRNGVEYALLAPTAMNQQNFEFILDGDKVMAVAGFGVCTKIDLGIVKYHFELGAGKENFSWKE